MHLESLQLQELKKVVASGKTRSESWRRKQLAKLSMLLKNHEQEILEALSKDLSKPQTEALFEIIAIKQELKIVQKNLSKWIQTKQINVPLSLRPASASIIPVLAPV